VPSKSIMHLDLSSCQMTSISASYLFREMIDNQSICHLDVSSRHGSSSTQNSISGNALKDLVKLLRTNKFLVILNISGN